jgi:nucleotide-binding universal stress UspA family protein
MGIKDILVHVDNTSASEFRIALAAEIARLFRTDLTGLYIKPLPIPAGYLGSDIGIFVDDAAFDTNNVQIQTRIEAAAKSAEALFRSVLHQYRIEGTWKVAIGSMVREVCLWAHHMDLAIIGRSDPEAIGTDISAVGEILLSIGRPIIIVPRGYVSLHIGEHILIAWQPQREAARAVSDSLPFLRLAKSVTVVAAESHSNQHDATSLSLETLRRHLARHGVAARMRSVPTGAKSIGESILAEARSDNVDLIVSGAYGHSRLRELIFGGVTRSLLEASDIPLLMSH